MITWNDENHEFYYYAYIYNEPDGEKYYTEYSTGTYSTPCKTALSKTEPLSYSQKTIIVDMSYPSSIFSEKQNPVWLKVGRQLVGITTPSAGFYHKSTPILKKHSEPLA